MRVIGITGSIACGKSTVTSYLSSLGYPVVDGDVLSRALTAPGGRALPAIRETFGPEFFLPDGSLDRRALGSLVFSSPRARSPSSARRASSTTMSSFPLQPLTYQNRFVFCASSATWGLIS